MTRVQSLVPDAPSLRPAADEPLYEVVNGQRVELPPMSAYEVNIASVLLIRMGEFVRPRQLGRVVNEMLFALRPSQSQQRRPDVAFISYDRWPRDRPVPRTNAWEIVPDLFVEVVSPTNFAEEVVARVVEYFQAGASQSWVIYPTVRQIYVYSSPTQVRILTHADEIDPTPLLPGFRLPVAALFEDEDPPA
jgi:Uma2 family endonuclease